MESTRRGIMTAAGAAVAIAAAGQQAFAAWEASERYPDPAIQVLDPAFNKYRLLHASVERLSTGARWSEGPVCIGDGRCLLWSDIPNNRIMRWDEETGRTSVYRKPSNNANGNTRDRQGRLVTCEHDARRITRTEYDGTITVLCDKFDGKPLNSPNDIVVKSDDSIWFTDPPFGILGNYEGHVATPELPTNVYRLDRKTGQVSRDRRRLPAERPRVLARREQALRHQRLRGAARDSRLRRRRQRHQARQRRVFITPSRAARRTASASTSTAICGAAGAWAAQHDGVKVFDSDGKPIGFIALPERCANLCFGGPKRNRLFMAASHSLYSLYVNTQGVKGG